MGKDIPRYVCIHGHFYQPPRENPWLEAIEKQESAHPFHDWNERICKECYKPNTQARIMDPQGRLKDIVNNYEYISFNFGPTLLSWLEQHASHAYQLILHADAVSLSKRSGHGNAIAQPYNHMILPLASRKDKETQIIWGLRDFESRFKRYSEGMWLPETAVDSETLEIMIDNGIAFTILAPSQARRFRVNQNASWTDINSHPIDPSRPYVCNVGKGKQIVIFFYDGPISQAIAFEGLLNSGDEFKNRLMSAFSSGRTWPQLVHIATDGESYGHHHRFGEMALAYAVRLFMQDTSVQLTNYGEYLEKNPPTVQVEILEKTAWSCAHGVGRWMSDCGCSTSSKEGWNQAWRGPLRRSLDLLRDQLDAIFEKNGHKLFKLPWKARDEYIAVVLANHENAREFVEKQAGRELQNDEVVEALSLLEMQRNRMLMYTSCGWFFDDLTGIETLQILGYAARALQLAFRFEAGLMSEFLRELGPARSNIKPHIHGDRLFKDQIFPLIIGLSQVAAHEVISSLYDKVLPQNRLYCYEVKMIDFTRQEFSERLMLFGRVDVTSLVNLEKREFVFSALYLGALDLRCSIDDTRKTDVRYEDVKKELIETFHKNSSTELIRKLDTYFPRHYFAFKDLFRDQRDKVLKIVTKALFREQATLFGAFFRKNEDLARLIIDHGVSLPDTFRAAARFVLNREFLMELDKLSHGLFPDQLERVLADVSFWKIDLDTSSAREMLARNIHDLVQKLAANPSDPVVIGEINQYLGMAANLDIDFDMSAAQISLLRIARTLMADADVQAPDSFKLLAEKMSVII